MKWIHFILAAYLLAVTFYPCTDGDMVVLQSTEITHNHKHDTDSHNQEHDTCPPFCICNCCGVQMINQVAVLGFNFPTPYRTIHLKESFYVSSLSDHYSGSIWQPPQLV